MLTLARPLAREDCEEEGLRSHPKWSNDDAGTASPRVQGRNAPSVGGSGRHGAFAGSSDDQRDGYIHLSALHQLAGTLAKHFKGQTDLVLITVDAAALGDKLKWEPSRKGDHFPHLYAALPTSAARNVQALDWDDSDLPIIPEDDR
jgi:uncharacterized protein (DUF952 family)